MTAPARTALRLPLLAALILGPVACAGAPGAPGGGGDGSAGAPRVRLALTWLPKRNMSPYSGDSGALTRAGIGETLVSYDDAKLAVPALAESAQVVDPRTVRFTLREGVRFHDGQPVDSTNVAASITHALAAKPAPQSLTGQRITAKAVDARTVEVTSATPDPILLERFAQSQTMILSPKAYEKDPNDPSAVGTATGPFVLTKIDGRNGFAADANPEYWGGRPKLGGVDVSYIPKPESRTSALLAGQIDIAENMPAAQMSRLAEKRVMVMPTPHYTLLYLNANRPTFADPAVRAAAQKAIDQQAIVSGPFEKQAVPATRLLVGPHWDTRTPRVTRPTPATPPKTPLTIATYDGRPELPGTISLVADQLRKAGFVVNPPVVRSWEAIEPDIRRGAFDAVISAPFIVGDRATSMQRVFGCKGPQNYAQLCDQRIDAAIAAAVAEPNLGRRADKTLLAEGVVLSGTPVVPLVYMHLLVAHDPAVSGLVKDETNTRLITATTEKKAS